MNNSESIAYNTETKPHRKEVDKLKNMLPKSFSFYEKGIMWGIQAGALMGLFLIGLQLFNGENSITLKFFKYAFLALFLGIGLNTYKSYLYKDTIFKNGALLGAFITFISGLTLAVINAFAYITGSNFAFEKFGIESTNLGHFLSVSGALLFEVFILGMVITFIILQYIKSTYK